jgi:hypothetical protein
LLSVARFKNLNPDHYIANNKTDSNFAAYLIWVRLVRAYTVCRLMCLSDKLVALSRITKAMKTILKDEYVAGIWRRYLERELLWSVHRNRTGNPSQPGMYHAPSWSWVAVYGEVNPGLSNIETVDVLIKVESFHLEYSIDDKIASI